MLVDVLPNAVNVVPARVTVSVDARAAEPGQLEALIQEIGFDATHRLDPVAMSGAPLAALRAVLPGVPELLSWLSPRSDVKLGLLTGNYEPVARLKLGRAGIGKHFSGGPGAFGSDAEDRAALPAIARRRAGRRGAPYARDRTIVIGDTPRDIACARADGVRCAAVATGPYGADGLAGADVVVRNAGELRGALEELLAVA